MPEPLKYTKSIFFSYSDIEQDKALYRKINSHFASYVRNKLILIIDKDEIFKRSADKQNAFKLLRESDVAVPLLSADYLNSTDCYEQLTTAVSEKKMIIPVLLRNVDIEGNEELKTIKNKILPGDGRSVLQHFDNTQDDDSILVDISKRIKDSVFMEFEKTTISTDSRKFYYILGGIILGMGICAAIYAYHELEDITVSIFALLLFISVALFTLKNALFPTKLKRNS